MGEPILAAQNTWFSQGGTSVKRASITQIDIVNGPYTPTSTVTSSWDASAAKDGSVMAYVEGTKLTIAGNGSGKVYANADSSYAFSVSSGSDRFTKLTTIRGCNLFDTSNATTFKNMFDRASVLSSLDVSNWNTSKVTSMQNMFQGCISIEELDLSKWDVGEVTSMQNMFYSQESLGAMKLQTIGSVGNWNTGKVTSMKSMFCYCKNLEVLDVSNWDTHSVTTMRLMFDECISLTALDVSKWNTGKVTDFSGMFQGSTNAGDMKLTKLDVSNWDTSSATEMTHVFYGCAQLTELDLSNWDVSKVTNMTHIFTDCYKMKRYNFSGWNTASLTNMDCMFNDNHALTSIDVSDFDTGKVTDFDQLFEYCPNLKTIIGLDKWDTTSLTHAQQTFSGCSSLTELNLSSWDTSKITHFNDMFNGCTKLKTIYVSDKWTASALSSGQDANMFAGCTSLIGGDGTVFSSNSINASYARIDGGTENPGYLTNIDDPTQLLIKTGTLHKMGISVRQVTGGTSKYTTSEMVNALKDASSDISEQSGIIYRIANALEGKATPVSIKVSFDNGVLTIE